MLGAKTVSLMRDESTPMKDRYTVPTLALANAMAERMELIKSLKRVVPWLARLICDGGHKDCAGPIDAENALAEAQALLERFGQNK